MKQPITAVGHIMISDSVPDDDIPKYLTRGKKYLVVVSPRVGRCVIIDDETDELGVCITNDKHLSGGSWDIGFSTPTPCEFPGEKDDEEDASGGQATKTGKKYDTGKQKAGLLLEFPRALSLIIEAGTYGLEKYRSRGGWLHLDDGVTRYTDAVGRHLLAHLKGEEFDKESGISHLAHAAWGFLAVLELKERAKEMGADNHE